MKAKGKFLFMVLLLVMLVSFPGVALAQFDDYGYNAEGRLFKGTLDNWEALMMGLPSSPHELNELDTVYVNRQWDKLFDPMIEGSPPSGPGAWQKAELWEYFSGNQLGWTWHLNLEVVYSPNNPIPGAIVLEPEATGFIGFYCVDYYEWMEGPDGEKNVIANLSINRSIIQRALHFCPSE
ncbi:hypothetical protein UF75_0852 [Desulfosporosinus sp. I2]|uniref:hypothetical protein n=1 Tax=Desulfosporosinus sp. I2 TaxID=1617025 RepID=UPI0005ED7406|nr:hypothetical protein [Desulfosporosinus sp. I2]KJR48801.1 hypothetical protein UF75_0852 [Desulfosporosinus sp. I2]